MYFLFKFDNNKERNAEVCKGDGISYQYVGERGNLNTSDVALKPVASFSVKASS